MPSFLRMPCAFYTSLYLLSDHGASLAVVPDDRNSIRMHLSYRQVRIRRSGDQQGILHRCLSCDVRWKATAFFHKEPPTGRTSDKEWWGVPSEDRNRTSIWLWKPMDALAPSSMVDRFFQPVPVAITKRAAMHAVTIIPCSRPSSRNSLYAVVTYPAM